MDKQHRLFAAIGHPRDLYHFFEERSKALPRAAEFTKSAAKALLKDATPFVADYWRDIIPSHDAVLSGVHIIAPITASCLMERPKAAFEKILECVRKAELLGADIIALGGVTSIVHRRYVSSSSGNNISITSGNTLTCAAAARQLEAAVFERGDSLARQSVAIVGATGDIGGALCELLLGQIKEIILVGRHKVRVEQLAQRLTAKRSGTQITLASLSESCKIADAFMFCTSAPGLVTGSAGFKRGALVVDIGYPHNVVLSDLVETSIEVINGGLMKLPTPLNFSMDIGLPSSEILYGCYAEALTIASDPSLKNLINGTDLVNKESIELLYQGATRLGLCAAPIKTVRRLPYHINRGLDRELVSEI